MLHLIQWPDTWDDSWRRRHFRHLCLTQVPQKARWALCLCTGPLQPIHRDLVTVATSVQREILHTHDALDKIPPLWNELITAVHEQNAADVQLETAQDGTQVNFPLCNASRASTETSTAAPLCGANAFLMHQLPTGTLTTCTTVQ